MDKHESIINNKKSKYCLVIHNKHVTIGLWNLLYRTEARRHDKKSFALSPKPYGDD